jgi:uncharacterized protein (DUF849 family)
MWAITGIVPTKEIDPHLPVTEEEIVFAARQVGMIEAGTIIGLQKAGDSL